MDTVIGVIFGIIFILIFLSLLAFIGQFILPIIFVGLVYKIAREVRWWL